MIWLIVLGIIYLVIGIVMVFYDCNKPVQDRKIYTYKKHMIIFHILFWPLLIYFEMDRQCSTLKDQTGHTLTIPKKLKFFLYLSVIQILTPMACFIGYVKGYLFSSHQNPNNINYREVNLYRDFSGAEKIKSVLELCSAWLECCYLTFFDGTVLQLPNVKFGTDLFFLGSVDYFARHCCLSDRMFGETAIQFLVNFNQTDEKDARVLLSNWNHLLENESSREIIQQGGKSAQDWFTKANPGSFGLLVVMCGEWRRNPDLLKNCDYDYLYQRSLIK